MARWRFWSGCGSISTACQRHAQQSGLSFDNTEEQYDYAISLLNTGFYEEARDQFERISRPTRLPTMLYYGLAILESMTGLAEPCLEHLAKAIELSPRNRIQARSDSDFRIWPMILVSPNYSTPKFRRRKHRALSQERSRSMHPRSGDRRKSASWRRLAL